MKEREALRMTGAHNTNTRPPSPNKNTSSGQYRRVSATVAASTSKAASQCKFPCSYAWKGWYVCVRVGGWRESERERERVRACCFLCAYACAYLDECVFKFGMYVVHVTLYDSTHCPFSHKPWHLHARSSNLSLFLYLFLSVSLSFSFTNTNTHILSPETDVVACQIRNWYVLF